MSSEIIEKQNPASETSDRSSGTAPTQRFLVVVMIAVFLVAGAAIAVALRLGERRSLAKETEELAVPTVIVIQPKPEPPKQEIVLPSTLEAYTESPIYARTS